MLLQLVKVTPGSKVLNNMAQSQGSMKVVHSTMKIHRYPSLTDNMKWILSSCFHGLHQSLVRPRPVFARACLAAHNSYHIKCYSTHHGNHAKNLGRGFDWHRKQPADWNQSIRNDLVTPPLSTSLHAFFWLHSRNIACSEEDANWIHATRHIPRLPTFTLAITCKTHLAVGSGLTENAQLPQNVK